MISNTTDLIFFGLVGLPIMLAFALMPFAMIERYYARKDWTMPSYRAVLVTRSLAALCAVGIAVSALGYLAGLSNT